jgi:hypothetical protein
MIQRNIALEVAPERRAHATICDGDACFLKCTDHLPSARSLLLRRGVLVALQKGWGRTEADSTFDMQSTRRDRPAKALLVEIQSRKVDALARCQARDNILRIRHAWNPLRTHEGYGLYLAKSREREGVDQRNLVGCGDRRAFDLESLPRSFLVDGNEIRIAQWFLLRMIARTAASPMLSHSAHELDADCKLRNRQEDDCQSHLNRRQRCHGTNVSVGPVTQHRRAENLSPGCK